ncbi:hypothetical protein HPB47_022359, partial [Ixodes persulcatus]
HMERQQREIGRQALGCHGGVANEAVQGELGWSSFEAREATSKITYYGRLRHMDSCRWARRLFMYTHLTGLRTRWQKHLHQLEHKYGFFSDPVEASSEREWASEFKKKVRDNEAQQWLRDAQTNLGSRLLSEARAGALRTPVYRRRFDATVTSSACRVCGGYNETVERVVLDCAGLQPSRCPRLQSPLVLAEALGFTITEIGRNQADSSDAQSSAPTQIKGPSSGRHRLVVATKRRLEDWWNKIHLRGH